MTTKHLPAPWPNEWRSNGPRAADEIYCILLCVEPPPGSPRGTPMQDWASIAITDHNAERRAATAEHVIRCVNAHDDLVAALQALLHDVNSRGYYVSEHALWAAKQALANVEG